MNDITLKLEARSATGRQAARLRQEGLVPSVVYGASLEAVTTQSPLVETTKMVRQAGKHTPVQLQLPNGPRLAIIKNIDRHPVTHIVRHVAFHAVKQNEVISTEVPIRLSGEGESLAERAGLVVLQALETIEIKARPGDLPEALEASVLELATTDDKLTLGDIKLPNGVEFADVEQSLDVVIASVYEPSALQAANDAAGGEATDAGAEDVEADNGGDTDMTSQASESRPGGKEQKEPKQLNVDSFKHDK